jgi:hypothetical protein
MSGMPPAEPVVADVTQRLSRPPPGEGRRPSGAPEVWRHRPAQVDALLRAARFSLPRREAVGFGPFTCRAQTWCRPGVSAAPGASAALLVKLGVDPAHLRAQLTPDNLDLVGRLLGAQALEVLLPGAVFGDPLARECAVLDLGQKLLHRRA